MMDSITVVKYMGLSLWSNFVQIKTLRTRYHTCYVLIDMHPLILLASCWKQHYSSDNSSCTTVIGPYLFLFTTAEDDRSLLASQKVLLLLFSKSNSSLSVNTVLIFVFHVDNILQTHTQTDR